MMPLWLWQSPTHVDGLDTGNGASNLPDWTGTGRSEERRNPAHGTGQLIFHLRISRHLRLGTHPRIASCGQSGGTV
jgi:hypothetical protein